MGALGGGFGHVAHGAAFLVEDAVPGGFDCEQHIGAGVPIRHRKDVQLVDVLVVVRQPVMCGLEHRPQILGVQPGDRLIQRIFLRQVCPLLRRIGHRGRIGSGCHLGFSIHNIPCLASAQVQSQRQHSVSRAAWLTICATI